MPSFRDAAIGKVNSCLTDNADIANLGRISAYIQSARAHMLAAFDPDFINAHFQSTKRTKQCVIDDIGFALSTPSGLTDEEKKTLVSISRELDNEAPLSSSLLEEFRPMLTEVGEQVERRRIADIVDCMMI